MRRELNQSGEPIKHWIFQKTNQIKTYIITRF
jgi:hypothetical protein